MDDNQTNNKYRPKKTVNPWMFATPLRAKDVYGKWLYISAEHYNNPERVMIPICQRDGLKRLYAPSGKDGFNSIHRENIAEVREAHPCS